MGYEGEKISKKVTIISYKDQPFKITDISSDVNDEIKYKLKTKKKEKEYTLEVKNRSTKVGSFRGKIELKTNSQKKPLIVLPVYGRLKKELIIKPTSLSFGVIDTGKEVIDPKGLRKTVMLKKVRGDDLTIKKIKTSEDWIMTETEGEGKKYTISITLDKDKLPKGPFEEKVKIYSNYKRKAIVVNLKGEVI